MGSCIDRPVVTKDAVLPSLHRPGYESKADFKNSKKLSVGAIAEGGYQYA
jgi:hypothetical protein